MKKIIRILSLLMALLMLAACFAACGGDKEKKKENEKEVNVDEDVLEFRERLGDLDFGGETVSFIVAGGDEDMEDDSLQTRSIALFDTTDLSYAVDSAIVDRNTAVEKEIGVTIELKKVVAMGGLSSVLTTNLSTGIHEYDIVSGYQYFDVGLTIGESSGNFLNYETLSEEENHIHLDQPYWDKYLYDSMTYQECAFWVTGDLSQSWVGSVSVSFVNKTMWDKYADTIATLAPAHGVSDLYEIVDKGYWTMDLIIEISKAIYSDDNDNDKIDLGDTVGYASYSPSLNTTMTDVLAAGAKITFSTMQDGVPAITFKNSRTNLFANTMYKLYTSSKALLMEWQDKYIVELFAEGKILMTPNWLTRAETDLSEMTDTYLVLPPPLLIEGEKYSTQYGDSVSQYGIPYTTRDIADKVDVATATLETMAFYSKKLITPVYYDQMLKGRYTHIDADSQKQAELIDLIRDSKYTDFAMIWSNKLGNVTWFFRQNCTNNSIITAIESQESAWSKKLDDVLIEIEEAGWM